MKWNIKKINPWKIIEYSRKGMNLSYPAIRTFVNRDIDASTAKSLVENPPSLFVEPHLIIGIEDVAAEIISHLGQNKTFCIYADYDVDGMTSGFVASSYLRSLGEKVEVKYPERSEGYGINLDYCKKLSKRASSGESLVVITVDNGITKTREIDFLNKNNIPVIITDHHEPQGELPDCPILDPYVGDSIIGRNLCGAAVFWKIALYIHKILLAEKFPLPKSYKHPNIFIPYVAIGLIGDMMPMTIENMAIISAGLNMIRQHKVHVLDVLFKEGLFGSSRINTKSIAFGLNSYMNACSRLEDIEAACHLFEKENENTDDIYLYGKQMEKLNNERKQFTKEAMNYIQEKYMPTETDYFILAEINDYPTGICGLIANKILEQYGLPCAVFKNETSDIITASCRCPSGVNIITALELAKKSNIVYDYGGHAEACGIKIRKGLQLKQFKQFMNNYCKTTMKKVIQTEQSLVIDAVITCEDLVGNLRNELDLIPCDNSCRPIFCIKNAEIEAEKPNSNKDHVRYLLHDGTGSISFIEWHGYPRYEALNCPHKVDIAFEIEDFGIHVYGKTPEDLNLKIIDMKASE